jgi:hypothetical protein
VANGKYVVPKTHVVISVFCQTVFEFTRKYARTHFERHKLKLFNGTASLILGQHILSKRNRYVKYELTWREHM